MGNGDDAGMSDAGDVEVGYVREGGDGGDADPMGGLDGGCQCHTGVGAKRINGAFALLGAALALTWRRRRRR